MFKRVAAPATGRSPFASTLPLSGSGEERTARRVEAVARGRLAVGRRHVLVRGEGIVEILRSQNVRDDDVVGKAGDGLAELCIALTFPLLPASFHTECRVRRHVVAFVGAELCA